MRLRTALWLLVMGYMAGVVTPFALGDRLGSVLLTTGARFTAASQRPVVETLTDLPMQKVRR